MNKSRIPNIDATSKIMRSRQYRAPCIVHEKIGASASVGETTLVSTRDPVASARLPPTLNRNISDHLSSLVCAPRKMGNRIYLNKGGREKTVCFRDDL